ncbi:MAG TPA: hypothetical protein VHN15_12405 [Thermoanaerobaculia bacterium]|nr:hypothetical protein [Thermoanaerobaculia bacterium]
MSLGLKILTVVLGVFAVLFVGAGLALATTVVRAGMVTLEVQERHGEDLHLAIPAGLLYAGLALAPSMSEEVEAEFERARREIELELGGMGPDLAALLQDLEDCPDAVLLEARSPGEHVRIEKRGRNLTIHVRDAGSNVNISIPAALMSRLAGAVS